MFYIAIIIYKRQDLLYLQSDKYIISNSLDDLTQYLALYYNICSIDNKRISPLRNKQYIVKIRLCYSTLQY